MTMTEIQVKIEAQNLKPNSLAPLGEEHQEGELPP